MPPTAIFLDIDGVLVDDMILGSEYERLMGDVLVPALGGTRTSWADANREVWPRLWAMERHWGDDPTERSRLEYTRSVRDMCDWLDIEAPDDEECARLGREFNVHVRGNSRAAFPDSAPAVRRLATDYDLHLATGNPSWCAEAVLDQMGVTGLFGLMCGPDLIGVPKGAESFYPRLFEAAQVRASRAVVVDDSAEQLALAARAGAATVLVHADGSPDAATLHAVIPGIASLPAVIAAL